MSEAKKQKLFNSITNIKDEHILPAYGSETVLKKRKIGLEILKYLSLVACIALAVFSGAKALIKNPELPMLTITDGNTGMGYEGYLAHDISELFNGNPWDGTADISCLPVYENKIKYDTYHCHTGQDPEKMREYLDELVEKFSLDKNCLTYADDSLNQEQIDKILQSSELNGKAPEDYSLPSTIYASDGKVKISVNIHMSANIEFLTHIPLSKDYDLSSFEGAYRLAEDLKNEYVLGKYKDVFKIKKPNTGFKNSDYNIYGERSLGVFFYEKGNSISESILNYNLYNIALTLDDDGMLWMINISNNTSETADKLGDYPIITADRAKCLLLQGKYVTSVVQWDMPGEEYIAKMELIYRADGHDEFFIPYYKFYIELPDASPAIREESGLKTYGAYYVPAVEEKYILNMPLYDGHIN